MHLKKKEIRLVLQSFQINVPLFHIPSKASFWVLSRLHELHREKEALDVRVIELEAELTAAFREHRFESLKSLFLF
jgi:hypothetical protein